MEGGPGSSRRATEERLRLAVTARAYWEVDQVLAVYRRDVEACWKAAASAVDRREIATEVTGLLQWTRHSILAARSHTQRKLQHLSRQGAYVASGARRVEQLDLDA